MEPGTIVLLVVIAITIAAMVGLYFLGKKTQAKKEEQDAQMAAVAQTVSMLIIDKKKMDTDMQRTFESILSEKNIPFCEFKY